MNYYGTHSKGGAKGAAAGFSSQFEQKVAVQLRSQRVPFDYEAHTIFYERPAEQCRYTPDFVLGNGVIVEVKGVWETADRKKHKLIRKQFPDLDIRLVFSNSHATIGKKSRTTYGMYCQSLGIPYADRQIPASWLASSPATDKARKAAIAAATAKPKSSS